MGYVRALASLCAGLLVGAVGWWLRPRELTPPIDIVGYPAFEDFNFHPIFWGFRLGMWVVPAVVLLTYLTLSRVGPLAARPRRERSARPGRFTSEETDEAVVASWRTGFRLVPPAVVLAWAVSSRSTPSEGWVTSEGVLAALAYAVGVLVLGLLLDRWRRRAGTPTTYAASLSAVHAPVAAAVTVVALGVFVRGTTTVTTSGQVDRWAWVPVPVVALLAVVAVLAVGWALRSGRTAELVELRVVTALVGAVAVYLATYVVFGSVGPIQGFDDMQSVTGADLLSRGEWPWRDVTFIHGVFEDALRSWVGFGLLERSLWATYAVAFVLWGPLAWAGFYLLAAWSAPRHWASLVLVLALVVWASYTIYVPIRWIAAAYVFILLGIALRRRRTRWTVLLTTALFVQAVLVPEAGYQVLAVTAVLVLSDLSRAPGTTWWRRLTMTRDFVLTGLSLSVAWILVLVAKGSLGAFLEYYLVFGPGHVESGVFPLDLEASTRFLVAYGVAMALVAVTLWTIAVVRLSGRTISDRQWLMLACALTAGLYGEKALGRADNGHLIQSIFVTIPLAVLWLTWLLPLADSALRTRVPHAPPVVSLAAVVALAIGIPSVADHLSRTPTHATAAVGEPAVPEIGFAVDDALDTVRLEDLATVLAALGAEDEGVFDFTNSPGYFHYLLGYDSPTSYYHVSMAIPEFAQDDLIEQLEDANPGVVVFDAPFGLPAWDGVINAVRHSLVSAYLLDGWTPYVRSHGVLFMVRDDLAAAAPEPEDIDGLNQPLETGDLHFAAPTCEWGAVPNFLTTDVDEAETVAVEMGDAQPVRRFELEGWAFDSAAGQASLPVLVAVGRRVQAVVPVGLSRPEVAEEVGRPEAEFTGFEFDGLTRERGEIAVYAQYLDGAARLIGGEAVVDELVLPGGATVPVADEPALGEVERLDESRGRLSTLDVPASLRESTGVLTFVSDVGIGRGRIEILDTTGTAPGRSRRIGFDSLMRAGDQVSLRVGACPQWHGYERPTLRLFQQGGPPVTRVLLSPFP